jgi:ketosteroid isomerase-like protein
MPRSDVEVLLASNAALNRLDVEGMLAVYADDAVVDDHRKVPFGTFHGIDELRGLYSGLVGSASEFHEVVEVLATREGLVVTHCEVTARLAADPTGPAIGAEYGFVVAIRDERIARLDIYDDGEAALEASGLPASA